MTVQQFGGRSDALVIGLVALAHLLSHFYQVVLGPLFPLLKAEFDVSYTALGLIISVLYGVSGVCQAFVGILVDKYGGDRLMLFGIITMSIAILLMAFAPAYWVFLPLAVLAAIGNCVFHPADLSILSAKISSRKLGRAFGIHGFGGSCGYFLSPIIVYYGVASIYGWRYGLIVAGLLGLAGASLIWRHRHMLKVQAEVIDAEKDESSSKDLVFYKNLMTSAPLISAFFYFALVAAVLAGLQSFSVTALVEIYNTPLSFAAAGITVYLGGTAVGILVGGELADRFEYPATIACVGLAFAAIFMGCIGLFEFSITIIIVLFSLVGFCSGITQPSRDILVKQVAPTGASGKTFGFVYSGLDLGGALAPIVFGWIMDGGQHRGIFLVAAALFGSAILTILKIRRD